MREGWLKTPVGQVVQQVRRPVSVEPGAKYPLLGVRWYGGGPFLREIGVGGVMKASRLFSTEPGDFIYNRLFAWKGSFGVVGEGLAGSFVSGEFPLFETDRSKITPGYLNLVMCQPEIWAQIERESTGSTSTSRNRWKEERFLEWPILLPPLADQRRIVDLIRAVDEVFEASETNVLRTLARAVRSQWLAAWDGPVKRLGDLARMGSGPSWKATEETAEPGAGRIRVLGITNTPPNGELILGDEKYVSGLSAATTFLTESSLLMIRTNGNRNRIGNVYRVPTEAVGCAFSAFQIGLHFTDADAARFAFHVLAEESIQGRISESASGSTGLGNIAVRWLKDLEIPWPDDSAERIAVSELFESLDGATRRSALLDTLFGALRSALVADLLSGSHEIPQSYDSVLEMAS